jgi:hypothetical protein
MERNEVLQEQRNRPNFAADNGRFPLDCNLTKADIHFGLLILKEETVSDAVLAALISTIGAIVVAILNRKKK